MIGCKRPVVRQPISLFCVRSLVVTCILGLLLLGGCPAVNAQVVFCPATGHYYETVSATGLNWIQARDAAKARTYLGKSGHLVTITSAAEQNFVVGTFANVLAGYLWIGAYQDTAAPDYSEPAGGWRWVTGEPWQYTAWNAGEPNNGSTIGVPAEDYGMLWSNGLWNDHALDSAATLGYLVEYDFPRPSFDLNGDGYADIVFQNTITNQIAFWYMNGTTFTGGAIANAIPSAGYALRGTGDFNGDGVPDLVFQNTTSGQVVVWFMNGSAVTGGSAIVQIPAAGYKLVGVGDFNADGSPDLVFQNDTSGQIAIWYMSGTQLIGYESTHEVPKSGYKVVGVGDFNGNGQSDLVFQNAATGAIVFWYMNGGQFQSGAFAQATAYANFKVVGVSDYNNDGQPDLLFQNTVTGQIAIWHMNGTALVGGGAVGVIPGSNYLVTGPH
ncbi:MAG: hypothetical protein JWL77_4787 [Chthonomonadaceae bacterium]|nr:hypothetical protein [Chthonomonadaceae bacterium]